MKRAVCFTLLFHSCSTLPAIRRKHHIREAVEAFLKRKDLEVAYQALMQGGWACQYFQNRSHQQEAAFKSHVQFLQLDYFWGRMGEKSV